MKHLFGILLFFLLLACDNNSTNRNPYLQEVSFRFALNLNLPLYSPLTNEGSAIYIGNAQLGTSGVFVIKTISSLTGFRAFEASCPNHAPNECSTMTLKGNSVTCSCEQYNYTLFTGQLLNKPTDGKRYYDMLEYRADLSGNTVIISN